jgi:hypothetical protein
MQTWMWLVIVALGLIKLPIAALMLWIPFRDDAALESLPSAESAPGDSSEDDGGSKTLPDGVGRGPHSPRLPLGGPGPRRGPHGSPAATPPARIRRARGGAGRVRAHR